MDNHLELSDLNDDVRTLIIECEVAGRRTLFERHGRPVAMLVSYDEFLALRETLEIANDVRLRAKLDMSEAAVTRGDLLLPEDLGVE